MSPAGGATEAPSIHSIRINTLAGDTVDLRQYAGRVVLAVNVASRCGFTPQYAGLQRLHEQHADRGFTVLGFPCNQFLRQEPGSAEQIQQFCSVNFGVTFPLFEKLDVKGRKQHPLFAILSQAPNDRGAAGDVRWNFEKFLVGRDGRVLRRWSSRREPEDPVVVAAIEEALATP